MDASKFQPAQPFLQNNTNTQIIYSFYSHAAHRPRLQLHYGIYKSARKNDGLDPKEFTVKP